VSIVGGEPLVRYRELNQILPRVVERGVHAQVVTSAVRPIPSEWIGLPRLQVVVSIDGLQPEHDERRKPATYERILKHIEGHQITVHCTVTRQQARRDGYIEEFLNFWQANAHTRLIWISLYTPQVGELSMERLTPSDRAKVIADLRRLRPHYSKLQMLDGILNVYATPPQSPEECIFAQTTECFSSDLERRIAPCQLQVERNETITRIPGEQNDLCPVKLASRNEIFAAHAIPAITLRSVFKTIMREYDPGKFRMIMPPGLQCEIKAVTFT